MCDFNIGCFNVRSIDLDVRKNYLDTDFEKYKLDVLCLQETKIKNGVDTNLVGGGRLICFPSNTPHYGNGFVINRRIIDNIYRTWKVSDRICVIQLCFNDNIKNVNNHGHGGKKKLISIINVYAPTSQKTTQDPELREQFYEDLHNTIISLDKKSLLLIAGDFKSKVGLKQNEETCLGNYSKGTRNENGENLVEFCEEHNLFITNSAFSHPSRHITTWSGQIRNKTTGKLINVYNQIDFIICKQNQKHLIRNARSYAGTILSSDHRLVKSTFKLNWSNLWKRQHRPQCHAPVINTSNLVTDQECVAKYQHTLDHRLEEHCENVSVNEKWRNVQTHILQSAQDSVGVVQKQKQNRTFDKEIASLSIQQKDIRVKIQNTQCEKRKEALKKERNKILHDINKKVAFNRNKEIEQLVENIDNSKNDRSMFQATKLLNKRPFENPKIEDKDGKLIADPDEILKVTTEHFKNKFNDSEQDSIINFSGNPRPLNEPISAKEVRKAFNALNNNKAAGEDGIHSELLKYATPTLDNEIASIFNSAFEKHQDLNINAGILIPIQKPGKPKGPPNNLRPIILLNTLRKALSLITLDRIRPQVESYLSQSQSGFRPDRSTADVVWTHRWLAAKSTAEDLEIKITGIDMSAAFDTVDRNILIEVLKEIINEDQLRLVQFLLSNTTISTKIKGASENLTFTSNIGTPQGDSLSPVLFTIYLENALRDVRLALPPSQLKHLVHLPREIIYADDVDFIDTDHADIQKIQSILAKHKLIVNTDKTDFTTLSRSNITWKNTKKVGSLIGTNEDITRRKHLSTAAMLKLNKLWFRKDKIRKATKLKLYRSLVKPILTYNCGTWALTGTQEKMIDAFHRKQLRKILNIRYPVKITNTSLYKKCNESRLSLQILESRWKLFGHILRRDTEIPANKSMLLYFSKTKSKHPGRPVTTLPITLHNDLSRLKSKSLKLKTEKDLEFLRTTAKNRRRWKILTRDIRKAAEASTSDD